MAPDRFRKHWGFVGMATAPLTLMMAAPASAQGLSMANMGGIAPMAFAVGAGGFAIIAVAALRKVLKDARATRRLASEQVASLRAMVDEYENLIAGNRELTVLWTEQAEGKARVLGQASAILPIGRPAQSILNLHSWLPPSQANRLAQFIDDLRLHGQSFSTSIETLDGRVVRASGWVMGGATALRLRPAFGQIVADHSQTEDDRDSARELLEILSKPAFVRDANHVLIYANPAYLALARTLGWSGKGELPELFGGEKLATHLKKCSKTDEPVTLPLDLGRLGRHELVEFPFGDGHAGFLRPLETAAAPQDPGVAHISGIIDALGTPIAIFNAKRELVQFNQAYAALWNLDPGFLVLGLDERAILDKLRTEGQLPNQVDYHTWRSQHLESYNRKEPFEAEPWHLPDGRTIKVISAPAGAQGGVIYVFEDMTERLALESTNKAFTNVLRETINALTEAVAVFGTNGRLTLSNPQLSKLWKVPMNELGANPHIDQIAKASGRAIPEDGDSIWRDLKRNIVDLNPTRTDQTGRITRSDGRLIDYAITRLPDGQTMMTFLDVTESAGYSKVLKERNDALVAADRLKDAFVENVSYELRSPLTNIIGFSDFLAEAEGDNLSPRQREYLDYIRASSVTLAVLIDNILDLASVDAGIAELNPEPQDVSALVEKARAGLTASLHDLSGEPPNLVIDIEPALPEFVADGTRMVQVLYNLLSNAARFSPPGGEIRLTVGHRAGRMLFVIEDEGPGLTDEMKSAILTRLDTAQPGGRQRGAGLALSIVRTFVNLHGGTITAERRDPKGSRIIVNLPLDSAMAGVAE